MNDFDHSAQPEYRVFFAIACDPKPCVVLCSSGNPKTFLFPPTPRQHNGPHTYPSNTHVATIPSKAPPKRESQRLDILPSVLDHVFPQLSQNLLHLEAFQLFVAIYYSFVSCISCDIIKYVTFYSTHFLALCSSGFQQSKAR